MRDRFDLSKDQMYDIEDQIAQILDARLAIVQLEAIVVANLHYGQIDREEADYLLALTAKVRRAIEHGLHFGRLVRNPPSDRPDLEQLMTLLSEQIER